MPIDCFCGIQAEVRCDRCDCAVCLSHLKPRAAWAPHNGGTCSRCLDAKQEHLRWQHDVMAWLAAHQREDLLEAAWERAGAIRRFGVPRKSTTARTSDPVEVVVYYTIDGSWGDGPAMPDTYYVVTRDGWFAKAEETPNRYGGGDVLMATDVDVSRGPMGRKRAEPVFTSTDRDWHELATWAVFDGWAPEVRAVD